MVRVSCQNRAVLCDPADSALLSIRHPAATRSLYPPDSTRRTGRTPPRKLDWTAIIRSPGKHPTEWTRSDLQQVCRQRLVTIRRFRSLLLTIIVVAEDWKLQMKEAKVARVPYVFFIMTFRLTSDGLLKTGTLVNSLFACRRRNNGRRINRCD